MREFQSDKSFTKSQLFLPLERPFVLELLDQLLHLVPSLLGLALLVRHLPGEDAAIAVEVATLLQEALGGFFAN